MKKILVLLLVTCVSGTAFAQRGFGYDESEGKRERKHMSRDLKDMKKREMPFIKDMPEAQQQQLFALKEKFLTDMQEVKQKYEKDELALKLELQKIGVSVDKKDREDRRGDRDERDERGGRAGKEISAEQAKVMLQAHEIKMKLHDLHRKARSEADALKMKMEQDSHKVYQAWVNTL